MSISVIIITKNEERNIEECLRSVSFADECIVVDHGSTDGTVEKAIAFGAVVSQTLDWPGFGPQKNRALAIAKGEWVFSLDADERVTPELQAEILKIINERPSVEGYEIPRLTNFCGKWIHYSGWFPDYHLRLFKRSAGKFSNDLVHESVVVKGKTDRLSHPLLHFSFRTHADCLRKMHQYSIAGANQAQSGGRKSSLTKAITFGTLEFIRTYFIKLGLLDGKEGIIIAILNAEAMYHKYLGLFLNMKSVDLN